MGILLATPTSKSSGPCPGAVCTKPTPSDAETYSSESIIE